MKLSQEQTSIIAVLRSQTSVLVVLTLALLAQMPHAASVFNLIVSAGHTSVIAQLHGYSYAVALELAVLLFVVQNRRLESYGFAVVSVLVNLSYYGLNGVQLFSFAAFPAFLVSIALPTAIALYSHAIADVAHPTQTDTQSVIETAQPDAQPPIITLNNLVHVQTAQIAPVHPTAQVVSEDNTQGEQCAIEQRKSVKSVNPHQEEFFAMLRSGCAINKSELSRQWNVATNTLRNWEDKFAELHT